MALPDFVAQIARDADPVSDGYQASAMYVILCLVVPIAMGLVGAALGFVVEKLVRPTNGDE